MSMGSDSADDEYGPIGFGPSDIQPTLNRINSGGTYPHKNDGTTFQNREGLLPSQPKGYYTEYVHPTPGVQGPGPQRVVTGQGGEIYFTPNHYKRFIRIR
ncbi:MAG: guanyl-specific ribonuclease Sa [Anaerolineae bacterium]|nr:guanyl-specific ribonuclease Sa [Anaerolineae bacterium]